LTVVIATTSSSIAEAKLVLTRGRAQPHDLRNGGSGNY
jgi:hypothetical protein